MINEIFPLLNRSIRGDALKPQAHWARLLSVVVLLLFLFVAHLRSSPIDTPGLAFFRSMAYLGIALISLAGVGHFANAITEEKEEGTLGLLLLANISPLAILLGKSTNRVLSTLLIFVAQFPFALLSLTLGGITVTQIFSTYLTLAAFLFLVANLALLASVVSRKSSEASAVALLLIVSVIALLPATKHTLDELTTRGFISQNGNITSALAELMTFHTSTSVIQQIGRIVEPHGNYSIISKQVQFSLILGSFIFLCSWLLFRRVVWTPESIEPHRVIISSRKTRWSFLVSRPWQAALSWKDFYFLSGGPLFFLARLIVLPLWIYLCHNYSVEIRQWTDVNGVQFARDSLIIILIVEALMLATLFYQTERKAGTLSTLLMLPLSVGQISFMKLLGCLISLIPTTLALIVTEILVNEGRISGYFSRINVPLAMGISLLLVLSHLTVLCSLIAKWGALPLAIGIMLTVGMILGPFIFGTMSLIAEAKQGALAEVSPLLYATGILVAGLQLEIGRRVRLIAGE